MAQTTNTGFNLTQATHAARLTVKYGAIALVFLMVGRVLLTAFIAYWKATHPPAPPPPTAGFGSLPPLTFPTLDDVERPATYTLETPTGTTPEFGDRAKVFLMVRSSPSLLADQTAREIAAAYNFVFEPEILDANTYRWVKSQPLESQLEMDIFTQHFALTTDYLARPELLTGSPLPDDFSSVSLVKSALSTAGLLPSDVSTAAGKVSYLKSLGGELGEAVSLSDADYVEVNLDRTPIDNAFPMYGPDAEKGAIHAVITGALSGPGAIVELQYNYQALDYAEVETYPIRTSQAAWKMLQSGEGYIARWKGTGTAIIRKVSLGYYESTDEQEYLQPIFIFEGDDDFLAYVSAVDPTAVQAQ
jgi:hypothetical protein